MAEYADNYAKSTSSSGQTLSRREFLSLAVGSAVAAGLGSAVRAAGEFAPVAQVAGSGTAESGGFSRVVLARNERVLLGPHARVRLLREMIDEGLTRLTGKIGPNEAWGQFITPGQRVLLKFALPIGQMETNDQLVEAMVDSLGEAGHRAENLLVADCPAAAYIGARLAGGGWSERTVKVLGRQEQLRAYLDDVDAIINVPLLMDHNLAGLSCAMMNVSLPLIRRPGRYSGDDLARAIVELNASEAVRPRVALTIVNAIRGVFEGGPAASSEYMADECALWMSADLVAADSLALDWVERQRRLRGLKSLAEEGRFPTYLEAAAGQGLGENDIRRIERVNVIL